MNRQFCRGCGTDVSGFLSVQDVVAKMEKYSTERKWSRVLKEAEAASGSVKLPGPKGKQLQQKRGTLQTDAQRKVLRLAELTAVVGNALEKQDLQGAAAAFFELETLDSNPDQVRARLKETEQRIEEADYQKALAATTAAERVGLWVAAIAAINGFLLDHSQSPHTGELRDRLAEIERQAREESAAILMKARALLEHHDLAAAFHHATQAHELCPTATEAADLHKIVLDQIARRDELAEAATKAEREGQTQEALRNWQAVLALDEPHPAAREAHVRIAEQMALRREDSRRRKLLAACLLGVAVLGIAVLLCLWQLANDGVLTQAEQELAKGDESAAGTTLTLGHITPLPWQRVRFSNVQQLVQAEHAIKGGNLQAAKDSLGKVKPPVFLREKLERLRSDLARAEQLEAERQAKVQAEAAAYVALGPSPTESGLKAFLDKYPSGTNFNPATIKYKQLVAERQEAEQLEADRQAKVQAEAAAYAALGPSPTEPGLEAFLDKYPSGTNFNPATTKYKQLVAERQEAERVKAEAEAYAALGDAPTEQAVKEFLDKYPAGAHFTHATGKHKQIVAERQEAERKATSEEARRAIANATRTNPFVNSLGMKFVPVAGTAVLFGVWDVRVRDYRAYASAAGGVDNSWQHVNFTQGDDHPVVRVSWEDAQAFCAWLTQKERREGRLSEQQSYRLPREVEWNRAVGNGKYPWGKQWPPPSGAGNYAASLGVDNYVNTSPVASFEANQHGLYDMGGNVWQWCEDWYDSEQRNRVLRGASFFIDSPEDLLSSCRYYRPPVFRYNFVGFRCVLVVGRSAR